MIKGAISYCSLSQKIDKIREQEKSAFEPKMQIYFESEEYGKLQENLRKAEDEDEYKNDTDPQGFFAYKKLVSLELTRPLLSLYLIHRLCSWTESWT